MLPKRTLGIGLAVASALFVSACAAGQQAQTAYEQSTQNGTNADLGSIHIRGMVIDAPDLPSYKSGDSATVKVVIVNSGNKPDLLESVSSPAFADWGSFNSPSDAAAVMSANKPSATGSAAPSGPQPAQNRQVVLPAGARMNWGTPESTGALALLNFTKQVWAGTTIPVTLRFAQAGTITISVPIALSSSVNTSPIATPTPSGIEG